MNKNSDYCVVCGKKTILKVEIKGEMIPLCYGKCRKIHRGKK
jgi:hypothetical protein